MMNFTMTPKAKVAARPHGLRGRTSRSAGNSFSAAADLVVKPSTPPKSISEGVGNSSISARPSARGSQADLKIDCALNVTKLGLPIKADANVINAAQTTLKEGGTNQEVHPEINQQEEASEEVAPSMLGPTATVEVRGLSGNSILRDDFQVSDRISSVKHRLLKIRSIPLWQQMLIFQGEMLNDQSQFGELNLLQDAVFELVLRSSPPREDFEELANLCNEVLSDGIKGVDSLTKGDVGEVRAMAMPPQGAETVCLAAVHVLAGFVPSIPLKRNGSPKSPDWSVCKLMMSDARTFLQQLRELPSYIDQGRLMEDRVVNCRNLIDTLGGDSESDKIRNVGRCSLMCQQVLRFLIGVVKYYYSVAEFRERFGGATIVELRSHQ